MNFVKQSIKLFFQSAVLLGAILAINLLLFKGTIQVSAMSATETKLFNLIEKYGEENVIVENGLSIKVGQEKTFVTQDIGQATSWVSTNDNIVKVVKNNTFKGVGPGTTFLVSEVNGKHHILEVFVDDGSRVSRNINTVSRSVNNATNGAFYKVFIDAGHGGKDPGAVANGVREADVNIGVALKVEQKLKAKNIDVMMSRTTNVFVELKERARLANEYGAHVFVSIHANAAGSSAARGIETYYHEDKPAHKVFASSLQNKLVNYTGANNRGVLSQDFLVNRETTMPSALVECGYLTNGSEAALLATDSYQEKLANAIVDGVVNYLQENIQPYKWVNVENKWYYVNPVTGEKKTGWVLDNKVWYYLDPQGVRQTGWIDYLGRKYYLDSEGKMKTGWLLLEDKWYCFEDSGAMKTGWALIGGKWYYFDKTGEMKIGFITDNNRKYYLGPSGAMQTGWVLDNNIWYYFDIYGAMQTGWIKPDKVWYYLDGNGEMKTGWIDYYGTKYYLNKYGAMETGWLVDGNTKYYLSESGAMQKGWLLQGGKWYYLDANGAMRTGWYRIDGAEYFFYDNGQMAANVLIEGRRINVYGRVS